MFKKYFERLTGEYNPLVLVALFLSIVMISKSYSRTFTVGISGSYSTIQDAIDAVQNPAPPANESDTILILPIGSEGYDKIKLENIKRTSNNKLYLIGQGSGTDIVCIREKNSGWENQDTVGILITNCSNIYLKDITVKKFITGVYLESGIPTVGNAEVPSIWTTNITLDGINVDSCGMDYKGIDFNYSRHDGDYYDQWSMWEEGPDIQRRKSKTLFFGCGINFGATRYFIDGKAYDQTVRDCEVINSKITNNRGHGICVMGMARNIKIDNCDVINSGRKDYVMDNGVKKDTCFNDYQKRVSYYPFVYNETLQKWVVSGNKTSHCMFTLNWAMYYSLKYLDIYENVNNGTDENPEWVKVPYRKKIQDYLDANGLNYKVYHEEALQDTQARAAIAWDISGTVYDGRGLIDYLKNYNRPLYDEIKKIVTDEMNKTITMKFGYISNIFIHSIKEREFARDEYVADGIKCVPDSVYVTNSEIAYAAFEGVHTYGARHILIKDNEIHHNDASGIQIESDTYKFSIERNDIHHNCLNGVGECAVWVDDSDDGSVINNYIHDDALAIAVTTARPTARKNGIYPKGWTKNIIVRNNLIYNIDQFQYNYSENFKAGNNAINLLSSDSCYVYNNSICGVGTDDPSKYGWSSFSTEAGTKFAKNEGIVVGGSGIFKNVMNNLVYDVKSIDIVEDGVLNTFYGRPLIYHSTNNIHYDDHIYNNGYFTEGWYSYIDSDIPLKVGFINSSSDYSSVFNTFTQSVHDAQSTFSNDPLYELNSFAQNNNPYEFAANGNIYDFLKVKADYSNIGSYQTKITVASNGSNTITVEDCNVFSDGFGINGGDTLRIEGGIDNYIVVNVNKSLNEITLNKPVYASIGNGVSIQFNDVAPHIGAYFKPEQINAPTELTVISKTENQIQITWDSEYSNFKIYYASATDTNIVDLNTYPRSYTIQQLEASTAYTIKIKAVDGEEESEWSASITESTLSPQYPEWSSTETYYAGDTVTYNGHNYRAKWWTRGDRPDLSGEYDVWEHLCH